MASRFELEVSLNDGETWHFHKFVPSQTSTKWIRDYSAQKGQSHLLICRVRDTKTDSVVGEWKDGKLLTPPSQLTQVGLSEATIRPGTSNEYHVQLKPIMGDWAPVGHKDHPEFQDSYTRQELPELANRWSALKKQFPFGIRLVGTDGDIIAGPGASASTFSESVLSEAIYCGKCNSQVHLTGACKLCKKNEKNGTNLKICDQCKGPYDASQGSCLCHDNNCESVKIVKNLLEGKTSHASRHFTRQMARLAEAAILQMTRQITKTLEEGSDRAVPYTVDGTAISENGRTWRFTDLEWYMKPRGQMTHADGKPTNENLVKWVKDFEAATHPEGVNSHLGKTSVLRAQITRQSDRQILATYVNPIYQSLRDAPKL